MLSCKEITWRATDAAEGRLSWGARLTFRLHLAVCSHCRRYVRQLRLAVAVLARMPVAQPSAETVRAVLARQRT